MSTDNALGQIPDVDAQNPLKVSKTATGAGKASRPIQIFLAVMALIWFFPLGYAVLNSFRDSTTPRNMAMSRSAASR